MGEGKRGRGDEVRSKKQNRRFHLKTPVFFRGQKNRDAIKSIFNLSHLNHKEVRYFQNV
jgi:hypothetical protein